MKAFKLLALTSCVLLAAGNGVAQQNYSKSEGLLQYVDPYIGSGYHGHVFVGTSVPYGMVQLGPTNIHKGSPVPNITLCFSTVTTSKPN